MAESQKEYVWIMVNGQEWMLTYEVNLVMSYKATYDEPGEEVWVVNLDDIEIDRDGAVQRCMPDKQMEKICQDHFNSHY